MVIGIARHRHRHKFVVRGGYCIDIDTGTASQFCVGLCTVIGIGRYMPKHRFMTWGLLHKHRARWAYA
eukprot:8562694-Karenia_brevis.AAC.1